MTIIAACGLKREARIIAAAGGDMVAVIGGGVAAALERALEQAVQSDSCHPGEGRGGIGRMVLSCGIAGALDPSLEPGDIVIDGDDEVISPLHVALPHALPGRIVGSDAIAGTSADKRALAQRTGGTAVDMETHIAARVAARHGLPFGVVRVIADRMQDDLPPAALVGMRPDGGMALDAVLASLARRPGQLPALIRTGRQADRAFAGLRQAMAAVRRAGIDRLEI